VEILMEQRTERALLEFSFGVGSIVAKETASHSNFAFSPAALDSTKQPINFHTVVTAEQEEPKTGHEKLQNVKVRRSVGLANA
jgi:hypothetical protein